MDMLNKEISRAFRGISGIDEEFIRDLVEFLLRQFKDKERYTGEPCLSYVSSMARRLAEYNVDRASLLAAMTWNVFELNKNGQELLEKKYGAEVAELAGRMARLSHIKIHSGQNRETEKFRRLVLALARDVRVVLLRLMDRAHVLSAIDKFPTPTPLANARTAREIYAPLASRLGINRLKNELEDSSLRLLEPEEYVAIRNLVRERSSHHEMNVERIQMKIQEKLNEQNIAALVKGRIKNINSIYKKMQVQKINFDHVYDVIGLRIITESDLIQECYAVLGIIHTLWKPIPHRFKDFVAVPKENGYQSIHTSVVGPTGAPLEMQIRTGKMDYIAEMGLAAHWRYKEPGKKASRDSGKFTWMRKVMEYLTDDPNASDVVEIFKVDMFPTEVYVFTPQGDVKSLPAGSTVVDFAFSIHSKVGYHCRHGKVNNKLVPLKTVLSNGDIIEILTSRKSHPHADWLTFVRTSVARNKIRSYLRIQNRDSMIKSGIEIMKRELKRSRIALKGLFDTEEFEMVVDKSGFSSRDDLFAAIGFNECSTQHIINRLIALRANLSHEEKNVSEPRKNEPSFCKVKPAGGIQTEIRFARCCEPLPGDKIIGYVTQGRGISIHAKSCRSLQKLEKDRMIEVFWEEGEKPVYPVRIVFEGFQDDAIMQDVTRIVVESGAGIISQKIETVSVGVYKMRGVLMLETDSANETDRVIAGLKLHPSIKKVTLTRPRKQRNK